MSNIRDIHIHPRNVAYDAYVRSLAATVAAVDHRQHTERSSPIEPRPRRRSMAASALAPATTNIEIGRLAACAAAATVAAAAARAELDTAPSAEAFMASTRADAYDSAWHERLVDSGVDLSNIRDDYVATGIARYSPLVQGSPDAEVLINSELDIVAEDALDAVFGPSWQPVTRAELVAPPTGLAATGQYLDNGDDVAEITEHSRTWSRNFGDGVDL